MNVPAVTNAVKPNGQVAQPAQPTYAELLAKIQALELAASQPKNGVVFSIADKGGVSASGFGRFPTTLYAEQWLKLIDAIETQSLRNSIGKWLSEGAILLKANKDESVESVKARSVAYGKAMLPA